MSDKANLAAGGDDDAAIAAALSAALDQEDGIETETVELDDDSDDEGPTERTRDERGRFAKAEQAEDEPETVKPVEAIQKAPEAAPVQQEGQQQADAAQAPQEGPPQNYSVQTKASWNELPPYVRADIVRREQQMHAGMRRYEGCASVAEEAERAGTNLGAYVTRVRAVDKMLSQDFMGGIDAICRQYGVNPQSLAQAFSVRYGAAFEQPGQSIQPPQTAQFDMNAIVQQARQAVQSEFESREVNSVISSFANDPKHPFYANVEPMMAPLITQIKASEPHLPKSEILERAYEQACWAHPEIRPLLLKQQAGSTANQIQQKAAAASQARAASRSITGAPTLGASPRSAPQSSIEDDIRAAFDAAEGRV